jgi:hypothetical protein
MKLIDNIEISHVKEVVINHKVVYNHENDSYIRDDERSKQSVIDNDVMPKSMSADEMSEYIREYIGVKRWKIVLSSGTVNVFKKVKKTRRG